MATPVSIDQSDALSLAVSTAHDFRFDFEGFNGYELEFTFQRWTQRFPDQDFFQFWFIQEWDLVGDFC